MGNGKTVVPATKPAKQEKPINLGGLDSALIYTATGKIARAQHNADRHVALNGLTVKAALGSRMVNAQDIKYDVAKGFVTLEAATTK